MPIPYRRTFLKQDLARKLYPDSISSASALQQLRREINLYPTLKEQLEQAGNTRKHYYNKKILLQSQTKSLSCTQCKQA